MYKIIGADQKEYGPISAEQLRQWVIEGRVNGQTRVQGADATEWKTMAEVSEFASLWPNVPPPPPPPPMRTIPIAPLPRLPGASKLALWSMIAGIASFLCCCGWFIVSPTAIVLGAVALSRLKNQPELTGKGYAIAGIVLGILALIIYGAVFVICINNPDSMQRMQSFLQQQ